MTREELIAALDGDIPAHRACREALDHGAEFGVHDGTIPASSLAPTYRRREAHMRRVGTTTIGFLDAVERLDNLGEAPVRLGFVRTLDASYFFQLFLAATAPRVVAALGVNQG